jgi:hypothetical protein
MGSRAHEILSEWQVREGNVRCSCGHSGGIHYLRDGENVCELCGCVWDPKRCRICGHARAYHQGGVCRWQECGCTFICNCGGASDEHSAPGEMNDACAFGAGNQGGMS